MASDGQKPGTRALRGAEPSEGVTSRYVGEALQGNRESLEWVVTRFTPLLRAQAAWRLGSLQAQCAPEDVVAEAWLVALRRLPDLVTGEGPATRRLMAFLGTTILHITNHRIDQHLRKRVVPVPQPASSGGDVGRQLSDTVTGAVTRAARNETAAIIEATLAELEPRDREVIILRIVEGLSNQDTAARLGETPNTVSHRYRRALEKLRRALPEAVLDEFAAD
jgi:RNA polymerase sigma-70 factor (ECF subfamily)